MAATVGADCDQEVQTARLQAVGERLHQPPGAEARRELGLAETSPPPSHWSRRTVRASVDALGAYSLSGVWRLLHCLHLQRRPLRDQLYSPDPDDVAKVARLQRCRREAARHPAAAVLVFLDEMGYSRWPEGARDWMPAAPCAADRVHKAGPTNRPQRLIGARERAHGPGGRPRHLAGRPRAQVSTCSRRAQVYAAAQRIYVVQDNWSIPTHDDVQATLRQLPRIEPVWLPTSAPWLHPIEKLWRWLRRDVLKAHRRADDWPHLRQQVNAFLDQFAHGSPALLRSVGVVGDGHLAYALCSA
jgi:hypothetical protein